MNETLLGVGTLISTMPDKQLVALKIQFARQLYTECLQRHGKDHEQARIMLHYISTLEHRASLARSEENAPPLLKPCSKFSDFVLARC